MTDNSPIAHLRRWLDETGAAPDPDRLAFLLAEAWRTFDGNRQGGMSPDKLIGRIENPLWQPPILTFTIERHGRAQLGSPRADLQEWTLDLAARRASLSERRWRQLRPSAKGLDVKPIAAEIADAIGRNDRKDPRLKWLGERQVRVTVAKIEALAPGSAFKQTLKGRRERFKTVLAVALAVHGYRPDPAASDVSAGYQFLRDP